MSINADTVKVGDSVRRRRDGAHGVIAAIIDRTIVIEVDTRTEPKPALGSTTTAPITDWEPA